MNGIYVKMENIVNKKFWLKKKSKEELILCKLEDVIENKK